MTVARARWAGGLLTTVSLVVVLLAHATVYPSPVQASACCQTCEALEAACDDSCSSSSHDGGDSAQACYDSCYYWLYEWTYGCWTSCQYCQQAPGSECWSCLVSDHGSAPDYYHVEYCWETGSGFCV